jgi:hypothetical protein
MAKNAALRMVGQALPDFSPPVFAGFKDSPLISNAYRLRWLDALQDPEE